MVQRISIGVLWVVRDGVGLARALKRTMTDEKQCEHEGGNRAQ